MARPPISTALFTCVAWSRLVNKPSSSCTTPVDQPAAVRSSRQSGLNVDDRRIKLLEQLNSCISSLPKHLTAHLHTAVWAHELRLRAVQPVATLQGHRLRIPDRPRLETSRTAASLAALAACRGGSLPHRSNNHSDALGAPLPEHKAGLRGQVLGPLRIAARPRPHSPRSRSVSQAAAFTMW